jgi:hypothetical protein
MNTNNLNNLFESLTDKESFETALIEIAKRAFKEGFNQSSEGYNAEYTGDTKEELDECLTGEFKYFIENIQ